jgi:transposase
LISKVLHRNSKLKRFFQRIKAKKGSKVAAVALARKVLCILHHLLTNREMYQEEGVQKNVKLSIEKTAPPVEMSLEEMIQYIARAGFVVRKDEGMER